MYICDEEKYCSSDLQSLTTSKYTAQLSQNLSYVMAKSLGDFTGNVLSKPMPRKISSVSCSVLLNWVWYELRICHEFSAIGTGTPCMFHSVI